MTYNVRHFQKHALIRRIGETQTYRHLSFASMPAGWESAPMLSAAEIRSLPLYTQETDGVASLVSLQQRLDAQAEMLRLLMDRITKLEQPE